MKTVFTVIPDPDFSKLPVIIRQDYAGPDTPAVIVPPDREEPKDGGAPAPEGEKSGKYIPS